MLMRGKHSDAIQQLKARFLLEKRQFQEESQNKITSMAKQANKVSALPLYVCTKREHFFPEKDI